jgi:tetratricopeptide (TPR) repeat protein
MENLLEVEGNMAQQQPAPWSWEEDPVAVICCAVGLPAKAQQALEQAGNCYADEARCRTYLAEAAALAPQHPAVLIGEYRWHFYQGRLVEALAVGEQALAWAARHTALAQDWHEVQPNDAPFHDLAAALPRFYLFCLKGCGYLQLRLGRLDVGQAMLEKLCALDKADHLGGRALLQVLERRGRDDDD